MVSKKKVSEKKDKPKGIPIPAGTEQETGFTRGETEKSDGPVTLRQIKKVREKNKNKLDN
jgi:hypothetical protein